jgi:diguanylate cyclase (GGDEF)-like protein
MIEMVKLDNIGEQMERALILVVDDDPLNLVVLKQTLQKYYRVLSASNGQEALDVVSSNTIDLILLDIKMPKMDGYQVLKKLKNSPQTQSIPVIFISANDSHADEAKGLEMGAMDYITKPFSPPIVLVRVKNQLTIKQKNDLLEKLVSIDGLTEINNRRFFDENITKEWRRASRSGEEMSMLLIDIDHFKLFNDNYGHRAGDECLKMVASTLKSLCQRGSDFVARYGGEEFAVVFSPCHLDDAIKQAERLQKAVYDLSIPHKFSSTASVVTISIGVASSNLNGVNSVESLIEMADKGLYLAKDSGRNQVKSYT